MRGKNYVQLSIEYYCAIMSTIVAVASYCTTIVNSYSINANKFTKHDKELALMSLGVAL